MKIWGLKTTKYKMKKKHTLDKIYFDAELNSFSFPHGKFEVKKINNTLKSILSEKKT